MKNSRRKWQRNCGLTQVIGGTLPANEDHSSATWIRKIDEEGHDAKKRLGKRGRKLEVIWDWGQNASEMSTRR